MKAGVWKKDSCKIFENKWKEKDIIIMRNLEKLEDIRWLTT